MHAPSNQTEYKTVNAGNSTIELAASGDDILALRCDSKDIEQTDKLFWIEFFNAQCGLNISSDTTIKECWSGVEF